MFIMSTTKLKENEDFQEYSSCFSHLTAESSITGAKFLGNAQVSEKSRFFWIATFILSSVGCIVHGFDIYDKWNITPDIGVKTLYESSATIPHPAITICHQTKIKRKLLNYSEALNGAFYKDEIGDDSKKFFELALPLCTASHIKLINMMNPNFTNIVALNGFNFVKTMSKVQFPLNQTIIGIKTDKGFILENFEQVVNRVMTSEGFCATYNLQDYPQLFRQNVDLSSDFESYKCNRNSTWNPDFGYFNKSDFNQYPERLFSGTKSNIVFLLAQSGNDIDEACLGPEQGFKIYWHMPNEIPTFTNYSFILGVEESKKVIMKATQYRTPEDMRKFSPEKRNCYFNNENKLKFFKSYTQSHCELECRAQYMLKECGCVSFFMPRNSTTAVCDISKLACSVDAEDSYIEKNHLEDFHKCLCLPLCTQISYEIKYVKDMDFKTDKTLEIFGDSEQFYIDFPNGTISRLSIEFMNHIIKVEENFSTYGLQEFISDCGGLLGLFMGCSVLSIVEIFYNIFANTFVRRRKRVQDKLEENYRSDENVVIYIGNEKID